MSIIKIKSNIVKTPTQPQLNLTQPNPSWVLPENELGHPPPPPGNQCRQYLSCYLPDFYQTFKVGSWEHLEEIPTVMATFAPATFVHIRNISAVTDLILTKL